MIVKNKLFNVEKIMNSGQCFRITRDLRTFKGFKVRAYISGKDRSLYIEELDTGDYNFCCDDDEFEMWENYFDLSSDSDQIYEKFYNLMISYNNPEYLTDVDFLKNCAEFGRGIRILRQDKWEAMVSFIISQNNNIPRIKGIINKICELNNGAFPSPIEMSKLDLSKCGLGYRKKYLESLTEKAIDKSSEYHYIEYYHSEYELSNLIKHLKVNFLGVGDKVANCIALYGLHFLTAFPVDTWVKKILDVKFKHSNLYLVNSVSDENISLQRSLKGITQQYMYYYALNHKDEFN